MNHPPRKLPLTIVAILLLPILPVWAQENAVKASLLTDTSLAAPGSTIRVGVLLNIPPGSHIYWKNSGASGLPTEVEWSLPRGASIGELQWPAPKAFELDGLNEVFYGYEDQALLFATLTLPETSADTLTLAANVTWLLCLDDGVCIPGSEELTLDLRINESSRKSPVSATFDYYTVSIPKALESLDIALSYSWDRNTGELNIRIPENWRITRENSNREIGWYPETGSGWIVDILDPTRLVIRSKYSKQDPGPGILVLLLTDESNRTRLFVVPLPGPTQP